MKSRIRSLLLLLLALCFSGCGPSGADSARQKQESVQQRQRDVKIGYDEGRPLGVGHAQAGHGLPTDEGFRGMAYVRFERSGAADREVYQEGLRKGFTDGFASVKALPDRSALRPLSWDDLAPGRKIFGGNGEFEATLISADRSKGIITVRFPNDSVEEKRFDALRSYWFTK